MIINYLQIIQFEKKNQNQKFNGNLLECFNGYTKTSIRKPNVGKPYPINMRFGAKRGEEPNRMAKIMFNN